LVGRIGWADLGARGLTKGRNSGCNSKGSCQDDGTAQKRTIPHEASNTGRGRMLRRLGRIQRTCRLRLTGPRSSNGRSCRAANRAGRYCLGWSWAIFLVWPGTVALRFPLNLAAALIAGWLSYRLFEGPMGRLIRRWFQQPSPSHSSQFPAATKNVQCTHAFCTLPQRHRICETFVGKEDSGEIGPPGR
jgi:hypothetical protein